MEIPLLKPPGIIVYAGLNHGDVPNTPFGATFSTGWGTEAISRSLFELEWLCVTGVKLAQSYF